MQSPQHSACGLPSTDLDLMRNQERTQLQPAPALPEMDLLPLPAPIQYFFIPYIVADCILFVPLRRQ